MDELLKKNLIQLIDESIAELDELKKSNRFSASEIRIDGPGDGIAGKDPQGALGKEEDKKDDDDKDDEDEAKKAESCMDKAEDDKDDEEDDEDEQEEKDEAKKYDHEGMKKSMEEHSTLIKSYVDQRFASFESKIDSLSKLVQTLADSPVPSKSASYKNLAPLAKSMDAEPEQTLTKSVLLDKLFELKKSGKPVDASDIAYAELSNGSDLFKIAHKYNIK